MSVGSIFSGPGPFFRVRTRFSGRVHLFGSGSGPRVLFRIFSGPGPNFRVLDPTRDPLDTGWSFSSPIFPLKKITVEKDSSGNKLQQMWGIVYVEPEMQSVAAKRKLKKKSKTISNFFENCCIVFLNFSKVKFYLILNLCSLQKSGQNHYFVCKCRLSNLKTNVTQIEEDFWFQLWENLVVLRYWKTYYQESKKKQTFS